MPTYFLTLQYDGSRYNGWQKQGNTPNTIQEKLETLLTRLYGLPVEASGSGRTDAGVHALGQTVSFRVPKEADRYDCPQLVALLNQYLPEDIRALSCVQKDGRFHARLLAKSKIYEYRIDTGAAANVFTRRYALHVPQPLDLDAMNEAARLLCGTHDFKSFCDNKRMKKSTVRTIFHIELVQEENLLRLRFCGNGFLYHMVRILTGTLLEVGLRQRDPSSIPDILDAQDRAAAGPAAPAHGLFLVQVSY